MRKKVCATNESPIVRVNAGARKSALRSNGAFKVVKCENSCSSSSTIV